MFWTSNECFSIASIGFTCISIGKDINNWEAEHDVNVRIISYIKIRLNTKFVWDVAETDRQWTE